MSARTDSAVGWVQLLQSQLARELVEGLGVPVRRAAGLIGVAPSAVSQYLSGKRLGNLDPKLLARTDVRHFARSTAEELLRLDSPARGGLPAMVLRRAAEMAQLARTGMRPARRRGEHSPGSVVYQPRVVRVLRQRVVAEQAAVADCMRLAQKARDELTRAIFRQLASDSLRHAEIVASLTTYLDRGIGHTQVSGISRREIARLMERERVAEEQAGGDLAGRLGGVMSLLAASMEADERKHEQLLTGLLERGFEPPGATPPGHRGSNPRRSRSTHADGRRGSPARIAPAES